MDGIQLDKGPVQPRDVTTGRAVGLGHLLLFPGYTFSSNQRSPLDPLLPLPSPLPSRLHYLTALFLPHTQTPIFFHLLQLLQFLNISSPFTHQFFLSSSFSFFPFSLMVLSLFSTIYIRKKYFCC